MEDYIIEIDSSQRDPNIYSDPNDYTVYLNKHIYNVESIELIAGKIPTTQHLINSGNRQFQVDDTIVSIQEGNYTDGNTLASNLSSSLIGTTNVTSVSYQSNTHTIIFTGTDNFSFKFYSGLNGLNSSTDAGTPFNVLGFSGKDTEFTNYLESGYLDLMGPTNIIIKISTNDEECRKDIYTTSDEFSFDSGTWKKTALQPMKNEYTGRLNIFKDNLYNMIDYKPGDPVKFNFSKNADKVLNKIRIQWFYNVGNKLIPYDFNGRNHFMKLRVRGSIDKLNVLPRFEMSPPDKAETKVLEEHHESEKTDWKFWGTLVFILALVLFIWSRRTRAAGSPLQDQLPQTEL
jgi:hypothetical protein